MDMRYLLLYTLEEAIAKERCTRSAMFPTPCSSSTVSFLLKRGVTNVDFIRCLCYYLSNPVLEVEGSSLRGPRGRFFMATRPFPGHRFARYNWVSPLACHYLFSPGKPLQILHQSRIECVDHLQVLGGKGANEDEEGGAEDEEDEAGEDE